ncbi:YdcF family protein [Shewanella marinintestina]|uniref:YdcF family protein n=1 Tax=Shewanella marinintestina TaxID=190305 RepID=UPI00200E866C|nr:YdcF family protein [Shewanella marinintestina]MCL1146381.1 YdcF family protein [Shewanella marinintestina]
MSRVILVLGSPNDNQGRLGDIAISRCQAALLQYQLRPDSKVLLTGGFGEHFNQTHTAHALYCQAYLFEHGVPKTAFTDIALSRFTFEDAILSKPIIMEHGFNELCLVTSEFHMPRAKLIFSSIFTELKLSYVAAITPCPAAELQRLKQHELSVMDRERANLAALNAPNSRDQR